MTFATIVAALVLAVAPESNPPDAPTAAPEGEAAATPVPTTAQTLYDEGLRRYGAKDFAAAIAIFEKAFALEPRPDVLFAWAQATRLAGDCVRAEVLFEKFLATSPPEQQVDAARLAMKRCEAASVAAAVGRPPDPGDGKSSDGAKPIEVIVDARAQAARGQNRPWYRDLQGNTLVAAGLTSVVVGIGLVMAAHDHLNRSYSSIDAYREARDTAATRVNVGVGAIVVGSVAVTAGLVRYVWVSVGDAGAVATVGGRF